MCSLDHCFIYKETQQVQIQAADGLCVVRKTAKAALMRLSKSVMDMEVKCLKKKFKDKRFLPCVSVRWL